MPTLAPDKEELNPSHNTGQDEFDEIINNNFSGSEKEDLSRQANENLNPTTDNSDIANDLSERENDGGYSHTPSDDISSQEEQASPSLIKNDSQSKPQESPRINLKKPTSVIALVGGITSSIGLFFFIMSLPAFIIVGIKEVLVHGLSDGLSTLNNQRSERLIYKSITKDPMVSGCGTIKIKCRYSGMTKRGAKKFETRNPGTKVVIDGCNSFGRCKVKGVQFYDDNGKQRFVEAKNYKSYIKNSPAWRKNVYQYNKGIVASWRDKTAGKVFAKLGLTFGVRKSDKKPPGSDTESDKKAAEEEKKKKVARANARASSISKFSKAVGVFGAVCLIKQLIKSADPAIKASQMAKLAAEWINVADTIKSGKADGNSGVTNKISELGEKAVNKDGNGQTFSDSTGFQYAAYGKTLESGVGKYSLYDDREKRATDSLKEELNNVLPGLGIAVTASLKSANDITCSPAAQYGVAVVICGVETIGTAAGGSVVPVAGTAVGAVSGFAACVGQTIALGYVIGKGIEKIIDVLDLGAGDDDVTKDAIGGDAGNGVTGGFSVITAQNTQARGGYSVDPSTAKSYDSFSNNAQGDGYYSLQDQFDLENTHSFSYNMASTFLPRLIQVSSISSLPTGLASLSLTGSAMGNVQARTTINNKYDVCKDEDLKDKGIAADPFCIPQKTMDPRKVLGDESYNTGKVRGFTPNNNYDADKVMDFMLNPDKPWIDNDGNPIDYTFPDPDHNADYAEYLKCTEKDVTDTDLGPNDICGNPEKLSEPYKTRFAMFSSWTFDSALFDQLEDNDAGKSEEENATTSTNLPTGDGGTVSGTVKELAQKLLDNSSVSYPLDSASPNGSTKQVLEKLASGEPAPVTCPSAGGATVSVNEGMMKFLVELSQETTIGINAITDKCHSNGSNHYKGIAVDFECGAVPFDINLADPIANKYGGQRNSETCSGNDHWHYDFGGS